MILTLISYFQAVKDTFESRFRVSTNLQALKCAFESQFRVYTKQAVLTLVSAVGRAEEASADTPGLQATIVS